jgi:Ca-activated chloride channel family protein
VGLGEDVEPLVARLLRRTVAPLLTGLQVAGPGVVAVAPARLPDVYAGTPAQFVVELAAGATAVEVRAEGVGGALVRMVAVPAPAGAGSQAVAALFGREQVEDLELARAAGADDVDAAVEKLGLEFQLSTRLTSWVAVSERPSVDPRAPIRREVMPQALPFGMSVEGLGLRGALGVVASAPMELMIGSTRLRGAFQAEPMNSPPMRGPSNMLKGQASGGGVKRRVLAARLVRSGADELLLEVTVEGGRLEWAPGEVVQLKLEGGTLVKVKVALERTTAPGSYLPGVTLRLAVGCGGIELESVASVLVSGPVPLRLVVT